VKLNPVTLMKNPVMFVVEVGAAITTVFLVRDAVTGAPGIGFQFQISLWLWFTVLFATLPKRWRRRAGRPRQTASARRRPT